MNDNKRVIGNIMYFYYALLVHFILKSVVTNCNQETFNYISLFVLSGLYCDSFIDRRFLLCTSPL